MVLSTSMLVRETALTQKGYAACAVGDLLMLASSSSPSAKVTSAGERLSWARWMAWTQRHHPHTAPATETELREVAVVLAAVSQWQVFIAQGVCGQAGASCVHIISLG